MITSTTNAQVKYLLGLQKKGRLRNEENVFIVEGLRMAGELPAEQAQKIYLSESLYDRMHKGAEDKNIQSVKRLTEDVPYEVLADKVFEHVSDTKTPQGVLAVVRQKKYSLEEIMNVKEPFLMVLDNLQDPGNLGTIVRTAEGAGVDAVLMSRDCVDIYNPKTIRSTMGSIYRMPFIYVEDVAETVDLLNCKGVHTYAAHLDGERTYDKEDYSRGTAFLIGNEGNGLREEVARKAERWIRIPMCGKVESLNAAIAASVLMFEAGRQRRTE